MDTTLDEFKKPRTDLSACIGNDITLYLKNPQELASLNLPLEEGNRLECRLVGAERQGLWLEPKVWMENAVKHKKDLLHVFVVWENVLSIVKGYATADFMAVKEYRGLRPRG